MSPPSGEILTIGTELLLGDIVDTNSAHIAQALRQAGVNLYATATVGDNIDRISRAIRQGLERADFLITTGGLGPTVDDMTRQAVAAAAGVELEFQQELWGQIQTRFARFGRQPDENNRRQAHLPVGASAIENPIGTAPAFSLEFDSGILYALPGVPAEMKHLLHERVLPDLQQRFKLTHVIRSRLLRTAGVGESSLDSQIQDLEQADNPTLGIAAHPGRVDLRLTARAGSGAQADELLDKLEAELRARLGEFIYGVDDDSLERITLNLIKSREWQLVCLEGGSSGLLAASLGDQGPPFLEGRVLPATIAENLNLKLRQLMEDRQATCGLALTIQRSSESIEIKGWLITPEFEDHFERSYGGPPESAAAWGVSLLLEKLRRRLLK